MLFAATVYVPHIIYVIVCIVPAVVQGYHHNIMFPQDYKFALQYHQLLGWVAPH